MRLLKYEVGVGKNWGTRWRRSRVRLPIMSLEFFTDIILPTAKWSWGRLSL